tara:strand:- start:650 stop:1003 length:354 start_codon:yes stop_codon:yes gene_type:complete
MSDWNEKAVILENEEKIYGKFLQKAGAKKIDHLSLILYGDPINDNFLKKITFARHIYKVGDKLNKIAFKQYGDPRLWWVIAWFNGKPTDAHCKLGDTLLIPHPLEEVLIQAYERAPI